MILTVGTGDDLSRREHEAFGIAYLGPRERRAHLLETVAAVTALLDGRAFEGGATVPPVAGPLLPPPRDGGPDVWIGGTSEGAVRSAAELADGWNGWGLSNEVFAGRAALLRDASGSRDVAATWGGVALVGRDRAELDALVERRRADGKEPPPGAWLVDADGLVRGLGELRDAGAAWAILLVSGGRDRVELIAEVALPALGRDR
jgi:alkanesulfonate monooxygenase SsuD/methylene tetrahydromethanopterin reductase-like flavin-dependent oxidoreductase (luciferase family)